MKVTPIKPAGGKAPAPPKAPVTTTPVKTAPAVQGVSPGAYCAAAQKGAKGIGKTNSKTYFCKASSTDTRLRWRV